MTLGLYPIEKMSNLLADRITERIDMLSKALAPAEGRPPFTQQLSKAKAINWWRAHRYDDLGKQVMANMEPIAVLELDQALAQANEAEGLGGDTWQTNQL